MASAKVTPQENPQAAVEGVQKSALKVVAEPAERPTPKATIEDAKDFFKLFEFKHLRVLQSVLSDEIHAREKEAISTAKAEIRKIAEAMGMSVEALMSVKTPKAPSDAPKKTGTATYQHPNNPALIWKGMGKRPHWLIDLLDAGKSLESLRAAA